MRQYEAYSVLITDEKGKRGTGTLFYAENAASFYVLTCAHVIYTSHQINIQILIPAAGGPKEESIVVSRDHFRFSPIDKATVIGDDSTHTCDIAIIECAKGNLQLTPTRYALYPMTSGERIVAVGYPKGSDSPVYYQQDELTAKVLKNQDEQDYFIIRVDEAFLNSADREAELKGFSGSPVWDEESLGDQTLLFGGLMAIGVGSNINRGRVNVMNARLLQTLMRDEFGVTIESGLPMVDDSEIAPGYEEPEESPDQLMVRAGWIENERRKAQTYVDTLQLLKAVESTRLTIDNSEFSKCSDEQKISIYGVLHEAYRLARDFDIYDQISEEMRKAGLTSPRDDLTEAVRYYEAQELDKADEFIKKALSKNPAGNEERVLAMAIRAAKRDCDISAVSEFLGGRDQLLIKPKDEREEEFLYQTLGFVLSNYFKETTRALRCLNRAYQISGNFIILETLALTYYQHSIRDAFIEEGSDKIDPARIHTDAIEKARDALLRVFSAADEMWLKGTFGRAGLQIFKCFYFMHDNFRIYKHYHDVMKYFDFPDGETKRDIQLCYLDVAIRKEPVNIDDYDALTDHDKKFYELAILLEAPMRLFNVGLDIQAPISEKELLNVLTDGEKRLQELIETQTDDRLGFDGVHTSFANLYGNGIMRFQWHAISEVKRHCESIKNPTGIESFQIYIDELETYDFKAIENRYKAFFEKYDDIISFEEWCHFYIRHGEYLKTKELYDSVFDERKYLIEDQPEYFYRSYIDFTLAHQFDLTPALRCFVEHSDEFKDIFIYMSFEMDLKFATCTFNDPDQMLDDVKILLDEGLYTEADYNEKCLIINMLNCRPVQAEQYAGWAHGMHPLLSSKYERMLLVWKGAQVMPNTHWNSMQQWIASQMFDVYKKEKWLRNPKDILFESCTSENKAIVVDLWTLYFFVKVQAQEVMSHFKTIYITYDTVSMALQEINQVNDDDIRRVLIHLQREGNVKLLSPTLEQQLTVRNPSYNFMEVHSACLLAQELNCPAFVGEFRFEIPEQLRSKVIRPDNLKEVMDCVMDKKLLEAE